MRTYIRFIRWNGKQMYKHPVRWLVVTAVYTIALQLGLVAYQHKLERQVAHRQFPVQGETYNAWVRHNANDTLVERNKEHIS